VQNAQLVGGCSGTEGCSASHCCSTARTRRCATASHTAPATYPRTAINPAITPTLPSPSPVAKDARQTTVAITPASQQRQPGHIGAVLHRLPSVLTCRAGVVDRVMCVAGHSICPLVSFVGGGVALWLSASAAGIASSVAYSTFSAAHFVQLLLITLPRRGVFHLGVVLLEVTLDAIDVIARDIDPPREPCMTAAAAITPRGTAVRRSSTTSAISSL